MSQQIILNVIFVRHGDTNANARPRKCQGQLECELNDLGILKTFSLAHRLRREHFDAIYTSDLPCAKQTALEIAQGHMYAPIIEDQRLREKVAALMQDMGQYTGMCMKDIKNSIQGTSLKVALDECGEKSKVFKKRIVNFYNSLICRYLQSPPQSSYSPTRQTPKLSNLIKSLRLSVVPPQNPNQIKPFTVLVVTHGGFIKNLFDYLINDLEFHNGSQRPGFPRPSSYSRFAIFKEYSGANEFEFRGAVITRNCVAHCAKIKRNPKQLSPIKENPISLFKAADWYIETPHDPPKELPVRKKSLGW
jgi:broad specificity phosphatase PhoE